MEQTESGILLPDISTPLTQLENPDGDIETLHPDFNLLESQIPRLIPELQADHLYLGVDCVDVNAVRGLQFYWCAGYAGGWWPTFHPLCLAYPALYKAGRIFSYAVSHVEDADLCDCERGDLSVEEVVPWLSRQFARGLKKPGVYASWDTWMNGGLHDLLAHYGSNIRRIVAHYTYVASLAHPGFDAQQFTDHFANRNVDGNVAISSMFTKHPPIQHVNRLHLERFTGVYSTHKWGKLDERLIVEEYDGARKHPVKYKTYLPQLEARLYWLAHRVYSVAHDEPLKNNKPSWAEYYRGWRFQQLAHRAHGIQFT
jgi:hypothetical protein